VVLFEESWLLSQDVPACGSLHLLDVVFHDCQGGREGLHIGIKVRAQGIRSAAGQWWQRDQRQQQDDDKDQAAEQSTLYTRLERLAQR
jgi:hypothetical protein